LMRQLIPLTWTIMVGINFLGLVWFLLGTMVYKMVMPNPSLQTLTL